MLTQDFKLSRNAVYWDICLSFSRIGETIAPRSRPPLDLDVTYDHGSFQLYPVIVSWTIDAHDRLSDYHVPA